MKLAIKKIQTEFIKSSELKDIGITLTLNQKIFELCISIGEEEFFNTFVNAELLPNVFILYHKDQKQILEELFGTFWYDMSNLYEMWLDVGENIEDDKSLELTKEYNAISDFLIRTMMLISEQTDIAGEILLPKLLKLNNNLMEFMNNFLISCDEIGISDGVELFFESQLCLPIETKLDDIVQIKLQESMNLYNFNSSGLN